MLATHDRTKTNLHAHARLLAMIQNHGYSRLFGMNNAITQLDASTELLQTTLLSACEIGHLSFVSLLLEKGAQIDSHDEVSP